MDEVLHVFVLGKPNSVPLYPGIFPDVKSPSFLKLRQQSISSLWIHLDVVSDSLVNRESVYIQTRFEIRPRNLAQQELW